MGKVNKKKGMADRLSRPGKKVLSTNPFEVHVNRSKFEVLGRKSKNDRGLPGVSKAKFIKKRKVTLLQEYKVKDKANRFMDRRIGERNSAMTREDRILARFTAERMKNHKRKAAMFNLAEDEVLTHGGRSLAEIERFEDPRSDDDDIEGVGALDSQFVEEAHFGGGMLRKSENGPGSRMSVIDQLIADSKKRKAERQATKEKTLQMTEQLDTEWRELVPVVSSMAKRQQSEEEKDRPMTVTNENMEITEKESYDVLMNELRFVARGRPSDRLKSEDEIAVEEAKRLQELEQERLKRMRGDIDNDGSKTVVQHIRQHRSADDLDDGLDIEEEETFSLKYDKDGVAIGVERKEDNDKMNDESEELEVNSNESEEEDEGREEGSEGSGNESGEESDDSLADLKTTMELDDDDDDENEAILDNGNESALEVFQNTGNQIVEDTIAVVDNPQDTKPIAKEDEEGKEVLGNVCHTVKEAGCSGLGVPKEVKKKKKVTFNTEIQVRVDRIKENPEDSPLGADPEQATEEEVQKMEAKRFLMEEAARQLPYTFTIPKNYEELELLFNGRRPEERSVILERMIKCNHPSLGENNRVQLTDLFAYLLQSINDAQYHECWRVLEAMVPFMFDLVQFSPDAAANYLREVINEKYSDFIKQKNKYPPIETLMFLKLVPLLFPTSDKRHSVATPATVFICDILGSCQVKNRVSIASGLFLVSLVTEYTSLSGRFCPQAINFLCGVFHMASPPPGGDYNLTPVPPFKPEHRLLFLHQPVTRVDKLKMLSSDLVPGGLKIDDSFRVRSLHTAMELAFMLATISRGGDNDGVEPLPSASLALRRLLAHAKAINLTNYPEKIREGHNKLCQLLESIVSEDLPTILMAAKKPKALRLYEPNIQPVYEGRKRKLVMSEEKAEHLKLVHKYKKELKGAVRELRRDRVFLTKLKIKQQIASDNERKRRVKQIYSWGAQQQGEIKQLERKKKKK